MKQIENHFDGKTTYFAAGICVIGYYQAFTHKESKTVFENYDIPENIQKDVLDYFESVKNIKEFSEDEYIFIINQDGKAIQYIPNASEAVQLAAVNQNGFAIQYIPNASEEVQLAAVNQDRTAIEFIPNPSEAVQLAAVNNR